MIRRLSLRGRLLVAIGAVTLAALVLADAAVYISFRSYLYGRSDATLDAAHVPVYGEAIHPTHLNHPINLPPFPRRHFTFSSTLFCAIGRESAPGMFIEVRSSAGQVVNGERCAAYVAGSKSYAPKIPVKIPGLKRARRAQFNQPTVYFTTSSSAAKGPAFRVRAQRLPGGDVLLVAQTESGVNSSLGRLLVLEGLITLAVLMAALGLGRALVRVGLRPLRTSSAPRRRSPPVT